MRSKTRVVLGALAAVLVLANVWVVVGRTAAPSIVPGSWTAADRAEDRNKEALVAARKAMTTFLDVDYRTVDKQIKDVLALSTGTFKKDFDKAQVQYAALTREGQAVATASILEAGINRSDEDEAVVSIAANSKVLNKAVREAIAKGEKVDNTRLYYFDLTLTRVDDRSLLSNLEVIG